MEIALGRTACLEYSMLYDTLASGKRQHEYTRYEGINASVGNFSEAFAGLAGGALALISLRLPFYVQAIIASTAIPTAFTLVEPAFTRRKSHKGGLRDILSILNKILSGKEISGSICSFPPLLVPQRY
jgi:MFS family permease